MENHNSRIKEAEKGEPQLHNNSGHIYILEVVI